MPRMAPLPIDSLPDVKDALARYRQSLGFVPNSALILARKPKIVQALSQLAAAVWDPQGEVTTGFKRLLAHVASRAHGCRY